MATQRREETNVTLLSKTCTPSPASPAFVTIPLYVIRSGEEEAKDVRGEISSEMVTVVCLVLLSTALSCTLAVFKWVIVRCVPGETGELSIFFTFVLVVGSKLEERENTTAFSFLSISSPIVRKRSFESRGR